MPAKRDDLLMKDGCWELRLHHVRLQHVTATLNSYIRHYCPKTKMNLYWYSLPLIDTKCTGCGANPPEHIMGLWKLHNYDYIQTGVSN